MGVRKTVSALAASVAAIMVSFGLAAPAQAAADHYMYTDDWGTRGGVVYFWTYGDVVQVCDRDADGYGVRVRVTDSTQGLYKYTLGVGGVDRCKSVGASDGSPYNLREGNVFHFRICLEKNGSLYDCNYRYWVNEN